MIVGQSTFEGASAEPLDCKRGLHWSAEAKVPNDSLLTLTPLVVDILSNVVEGRNTFPLHPSVGFLTALDRNW